MTKNIIPLGTHTRFRSVERMIFLRFKGQGHNFGSDLLNCFSKGNFCSPDVATVHEYRMLKGQITNLSN